jgi:hypothetical protein
VANIIVILDDNGDLIRLLRIEQQQATLFQLPNTSPPRGGDFFFYLTNQTNQLTELEGLNNAIRNSAHLDDEGKARTLDLFNTITPTDQISYARQPGVFGAPLADVPGHPASLFPVFVDPH